MSTDGNRRAISIAASAFARFATKGSSLAFGCDPLMDAMASDTRASVRPFTITRVPSAASDLAMAKPIPAVEPVTKAVLFSSFRFMDVFGCVFHSTLNLPMVSEVIVDGREILAGVSFPHGEAIQFFRHIG